MLQFGRMNIEKATKDTQIEHEEEEDVASGEIHTPNNNDLKNNLLKSANGFKKQNNGYVPNGNSVISRDDKLILVPEPLAVIQNSEEGLETAKIEVSCLYDL